MIFSPTSPHIHNGSIRSFWCQIVRLFAETYPHKCIRTYQLGFSFASSLSVNGNTSTITSFPYYIPKREIAPSLQPDCSAECMVFSSSQPIFLLLYDESMFLLMFLTSKNSLLIQKQRVFFMFNPLPLLCIIQTTDSTYVLPICFLPIIGLPLLPGNC